MTQPTDLTFSPGVAPAASTVDSWICPVCSWTTQATGPATAGEPDEFQQDVDRHREGHLPEVDVFRCRVCGYTTAVDEEQDAHVRAHVAEERTGLRASHPGWGEVPSIPLWLTIADEVPELFDAFAAMTRKVSPTDLARVLRAAADVMDGGGE